jgi:hypothetical protein
VWRCSWQRSAATDDDGIIRFTFSFFRGNYPERTAAFILQIVAPFYEDLVRIAKPTLDVETPSETAAEPPTPRRTTEPAPFIANERIDELRELPSGTYDFRKLIRLSEELNIAWEHRCFLTVGMLTRAMIDHVPPVFGFRTFTEVANNYSAGGKSKKKIFEQMENVARQIANDFLHATIRDRETLPTDRQVDVSVEIDVLLGEVARIITVSARAEE